MVDWFRRLNTGGKVGVAAGGLAIVAIVAVVVVNLLSGDPGTAGPGPSSPAASPSPSPEPSAEPEPSDAPSPSPTPAPQVVFGPPHAAIVLVNGLNVRTEPVSGDVVGSLNEGDVVTIIEGPRTLEGIDWYLVGKRPDIQAWVSAGPSDGPYLDVRLSIARNVPATVEGLAAGPDGYVAWGRAARITGEPQRRYIATSADGVSWTMASPPDEVHDASFIWADGGPNGWLLAASDEINTDIAGIWRSIDGSSWEQVDASALPGPPQRVVGFAGGYAIALRDDSTGTSRGAVFTSPDGVAWRPVEIPDQDAFNELGLIETANGLVIYGEGPGTALALSSSDGVAWTDLSDSGANAQITGYAIRISRMGDSLVAFSQDLESGAIRVWRAEPATTGVAWVRQPAAESAMTSGTIEQLVGTSAGAFAFGHGFEDGRVRAWQTDDGAAWQELDASGLDADGGVNNVVAGPNGLVAVSFEVTNAGRNPVFLRATGATTWEPEASPVLGRVERAVVGACPEAPTTMIDWLGMPGAVGAECFGTDAATFLAYRTAPGGCGGFSPGFFEPQWLASPFAATIILEPNEAESGGCGSAVPDPSLSTAATTPWVEVTGHWAHPASADCRVRPDPQQAIGGPSSTLSPTSLAFECRTRFVVTAMSSAPGP